MERKKMYIPIPTPREMKIIDRCRRDGLVDDFKRVFERVKGCATQDLDDLFIKFVRVAKPSSCSQDTLKRCREEFQTQSITFRKAFGVAAVIVEGEIRRIMPSEEVGIAQEPPMSLRGELTKGQCGLVARRYVFGTALRQETFSRDRNVPAGNLKKR